jgi:short-subunit dehydrogenase
MKNPKRILITGASGGLGQALAFAYAMDGVQLFLTGRDTRKLAEVREDCVLKGALVVTKSIDVRNQKELREWILEIGHDYGLDLVIANAGISAGTSGGSESVEQALQIFEVNVDAVVNTVNTAVEILEKRNMGQIAIVSSLAGFNALPSCPSYSASKAAVRFYGEALRLSLKKSAIKVSVICPGYVKTPMTDVNQFPMPFLMSAKKAAKIIKCGLAKNKKLIVFPLRLYLIVRLMSVLPGFIINPILVKMPGKKALD